MEAYVTPRRLDNKRGPNVYLNWRKESGFFTYNAHGLCKQHPQTVPVFTLLGN